MPGPGLSRGEARVDVRLPNFVLSVVAPGATADEARAVAMIHREQLDSFLVSRRSPGDSGSESRVVALAFEAAERLGTGVERAASGALVQAVGEELAERLGEATVIANGIWFVASRRPREIALGAGGRVFGLRVEAGDPVAAFTSGARIEPLPGSVDAVAVVADTAGIVEAAAEEAAKLVRRPRDVARALAHLQRIPGVRGAVVVGGAAVAVFGGIRIDAA